MLPTYDLNKIKFSTGEATFKRAVGLYECGKVTEIGQLGGYYSALVLGAKPYRVSVSARNYKQGHCTCYLGEKDTLCKHMVALAIHAVMDGKPLSDKDKEFSHGIECNGRCGMLNKEELEVFKKSITESMRYIKPYRGPSRTWFANQDSLQEGCNRLSAVISNVQVSRQVADILVKLLLRLERKVSRGGVDDSNGIVGGLAGELVALLEQFARIDPTCIDAFEPLCGKEYCFGWEEPLVRILDERDAEEYNRQLEESENMRSNKKKEAEIIKAFKDKEFIDEDMAGFITDKIVEAMPTLKGAIDKYNMNPKDMIRFQMVSEMCWAERERKGLTFKQISVALKVPQYKLKDIEKSGVKTITVDILERYINFLGLNEWFNSWKKNNTDVYERLSKNKR